LIFLTIACGLAEAGDIYASCIKAYDFGAEGNSEITVYPLNKNCVESCAQACKVFSYTHNEIERNGAIINDCITNCQGGNNFSSRFINSYDGNLGKYLFGGLATVESSCQDQIAAKNSAVKTNLTSVVKLTAVKLSVAASGEQSIYLCGSKALTLTPVYSGVKINAPQSEDWSTSTFRNSITDRRVHPCLAGITDQAWNNLTLPPTVSRDYLINLFNAPRSNPGTAAREAETCLWNARWPNFYNTGIYAADGDDLSISWEGDYGYRSSPYLNKYQDRQTGLLCMQSFCAANGGNAANCNICKQYWSDNSVILLKSFATSDVNLAPDNNAPIQLRGENARSKLIDIQDFGCEQAFAGNQLFGLESSLADRNLVIDIEQAPKNLCEMKVVNAGIGYYNLTGRVSGLTTSRRLLALRHFDNFNSNVNNQISWYGDNIGGYTLNINWGGCPHTNGENLQYTISSVDEVIPDQFWQDVPSEVFIEGKKLVLQTPTYIGNGQVDQTKPGTLYLRIKPDQAPGNASNLVKSLYENPGNYRGSYTLNIDAISAISTSDGFLQKLVREVSDTLVGYDITSPQAIKPEHGGAIGSLYRGVVVQTNFINIITTLLTLYIAFTGVAYIIGVAKITQQDVLVRLLKTAVVITLISPQSWNILSTYLVDLFVIGTLQLTSMFSVDILSALQNKSIIISTTGAFNIFKSFDYAIDIITSEKFWLKVWSTGFIGGFFLIILIAVSVGYYFLSLIRVTAVFIFSLIMISILLVVSPIFIPLILFQLTKNIFDGWWKALFSFMLQPAMVFSAISIFHFLILIVIYSALAVTVCPTKCALVFFNKCVIDIYSPLSNMHDNYGLFDYSFGNLLTLGIILFGLSYTMFHSISFFSDIVARIISGVPNRLTSMGNLASSSIHGPKELYQSSISSIKGVREYTSSLKESFDRGRGKIR
jgi:type IV secretion system protein VirB6